VSSFSQVSQDSDLPYDYHIAGMRGAYLLVMAYWLRWGLIRFCLGWLWTIMLWMSAFQVAEITEVCLPALPYFCPWCFILKNFNPTESCTNSKINYLSG
jgi:hypothetical protein